MTGCETNGLALELTESVQLIFVNQSQTWKVISHCAASLPSLLHIPASLVSSCHRDKSLPLANLLS